MSALKWFAIHGRYRGHTWIGTYEAATLEAALAKARKDPHIEADGGHWLGDDYKPLTVRMRELPEERKK